MSAAACSGHGLMMVCISQCAAGVISSIMFSGSWSPVTASFVLEPVQQLPAGLPFGLSDLVAPPAPVAAPAGSNATGVKLGNPSHQLFSAAMKLAVYGYSTQMQVASLTAMSGVRFDASLSAALNGTWQEGCSACSYCGMYTSPSFGHVSAWLAADGLLHGTVMVHGVNSWPPPYGVSGSQQTFDASAPDVVVGTGATSDMQLFTEASSSVELLGHHLLLDRNAGLLAVTLQGRTNCTYPACYMDSWRFPSQLHVSAAMPHIPGASFEIALAQGYFYSAMGSYHGSIADGLSVVFDGFGWAHGLMGRFYYTAGTNGTFTLGIATKLQPAVPAAQHAWRRKWCANPTAHHNGVQGGMLLELSPASGVGAGRWVASEFADATLSDGTPALYEADLLLEDGSTVPDWGADVDAVVARSYSGFGPTLRDGVGVMKLLARHPWGNGRASVVAATLMPNSTVFDSVAGVMRASFVATQVQMCDNGTQPYIAQLTIVFANASHARATVVAGYSHYWGSHGNMPEAFTSALAASPQLVVNTDAAAWGIELTSGVNVSGTQRPVSASLTFDATNRLLHGELVYDLPETPDFIGQQRDYDGSCRQVWSPAQNTPSYRVCWPHAMNTSAVVPGLSVELSIGQWGKGWSAMNGYNSLQSSKPYSSSSFDREVTYATLGGKWVMQLQGHWLLASVLSDDPSASNSTSSDLPTHRRQVLRFIAQVASVFDRAVLDYKNAVCRLSDSSADGFTGNWTAASGQLNGLPFGGSLTLGPAWNPQAGGYHRFVTFQIDGAVSSTADLGAAGSGANSSMGSAVAWFNATVLMPEYAWPKWLHMFNVSIGPAASLELLSDGTRVIEGVASASVSVPCTQFQWGYRQEHPYVGTASLTVAADGTVTGGVKLWSAYLRWFPGCYPHHNDGYTTCKFPLALACVTPTAAHTVALQRSPAEASVALPMKPSMGPLVGSVMSAMLEPGNGTLAATIRVPLVYSSPEYAAISNWQALGGVYPGMSYPVFAITATLTDLGLQLQLECSSYYWSHPWRVDRCRSGSSMYPGPSGYPAVPGCPYYSQTCYVQNAVVSDASGKHISHVSGEITAIWRPPAGTEAAAREGKSMLDNSTFDGQALSTNSSSNSSQPSYDAELVLELFLNLPLEHVYNYRPSGDDGMPSCHCCTKGAGGGGGCASALLLLPSAPPYARWPCLWCVLDCRFVLQRHILRRHLVRRLQLPLWVPRGLQLCAQFLWVLALPDV